MQVRRLVTREGGRLPTGVHQHIPRGDFCPRDSGNVTEERCTDPDKNYCTCTQQHEELPWCEQHVKYHHDMLAERCLVISLPCSCNKTMHTLTRRLVIISIYLFINLLKCNVDTPDLCIRFVDVQICSV